MGLIAANIFESQSVLIHSIVGAADTRYMVANSGESELRKITWYVINKKIINILFYSKYSNMFSEIDWSKSSTMMPLYLLFTGTTSLNKQDTDKDKKQPACVRIRLKILPCLCLSRGEESIIWPQCLHVCIRPNYFVITWHNYIIIFA